jgi:HEPN domain-containing protein
MKNGIKEWLMIAKNDLVTATVLMKMGDAKAILQEEYCYTVAVVFHCHQAIEKYFKAFLLENSWNLVKTHDLPELYEEIKKIKDLNLNEAIIDKIYGRYSKTRYPEDYNPTTEEQAREFYK